MRDVPHEELQGASENILTLAKVYDVDLNEATRGAGQLMSQFGLSSQEAFNYLAAGAQEGLNYSDELFDNLVNMLLYLNKLVSAWTRCSPFLRTELKMVRTT